MTGFKWVDTHTYPDYNVIFTKKFVRAACRACGLSIDEGACEMLRRIVLEKETLFIDEVCGIVGGEGRRKIEERDVAESVQRRFPDLAGMTATLGLCYRIVKLSSQGDSWRCYLHFPFLGEDDRRLESAGFKKIYPGFYVIEKSPLTSSAGRGE